MADTKRTCTECGASISRVKPTGPLPTYCSRACKSRRYYRETHSPKAAREDIRCRWPECDAVLLPQTGRGRNAKWCESHRKAKKAATEAARRASRVSLCSKAACDHLVVGRGLCSTHYGHYLRDLGRLAPQEWNDTRKRNHQARRARKKGVTVEPVSIARVAERDGFMCGICETRVDMHLAYPDPFSQSLDHVLPLSKGGEHSYANTQLAHLRCNVSKGNRVLASA